MCAYYCMCTYIYICTYYCNMLLHVSYHYVKSLSVWSGRPRWLSCSLYIPSPPVPASRSPYSRDWPCYILNGLVSVLTFKSEHLLRDSLSKGWWGAYPSAGFPGNQWASLRSVLDNWWSFLPQKQTPLPCPLHTVGCCCRPLPPVCKLPLSMKPLMSLSPDSSPLLLSWNWASAGLAGLYAAVQHA